MAILIALFAIALALTLAPFELGRIRLGGVGLLWWYSVVVAPATAAALAIAFLPGGSD
jgi:hypothetical protein